MRKRLVAVIINEEAIQFISCARDHGGNGLPKGFGGFAQTMRDLVHLSNRRFFLELAKRQDPESLLRGIFDLVQSPEDRELVKSEAQVAYSAGKPPVQPKLLSVLEEIE